MIPISKYKYERIKSRRATILFFEENSLPSIQYRILFPGAGADYDTCHQKGKSGLAYMTAYLAEQGAGGLSSTALQEELNQLGVSINISVGRQTVIMELSGLSLHGERLWELFSKVLARPHFDKKEWKILQKQFLDGRLKFMDSPSAVSGELLRGALFRDSRGRPAGGTLNSLSNITLKDIKDFYRDNFQEGNPIFMATGKLNKPLKKKIVSFFDKSFSSDRTAGPKSFLHSKPPAQFKREAKNSGNFSNGFLDSKPPAQFKLLSKKDLLQSHVCIGRPLSPFPVKEPKKFLALQAAASILGGSMTSRLFMNLRVKKGLTYGTYSSVGFHKFYGLFSIKGTTKSSSTKELLEEALAILKNFCEWGVTPEELNRAKMELQSQHLKSMETPEDRLYQFAYYMDYLGVRASFLNGLDISNLSLSYVNRQIKEWISVKDLQIAVYGHPSLESQLKDIKTLPPLQKVTFKEHFKEELNPASAFYTDLAPRGKTED